MIVVMLLVCVELNCYPVNIPHTIEQVDGKSCNEVAEVDQEELQKAHPEMVVVGHECYTMQTEEEKGIRT